MKHNRTKELSLLNCEHEDKFQHLFVRHWILQSPLYYIWVIMGVIYTAVRVLFLTEATDQHVVNFIETTTMAVLVQEKHDGTFCLEVPHCVLRYHNGGCMDSFSVVYFKNNGSAIIKSFTLNGKQLTNRAQMFSVIRNYVMFSFHTKCHIFANYLTHRIVDGKMTTLQESALTSVPLHNALVMSDISPLTSTSTTRFFFEEYYFKTTRESAIQETENMSALLKHPDMTKLRESSIPFVKFLVEGRAAMIGVLQKYNIASDLWEALFNTIVVHATDHAGIWANTKTVRCNGNPTMTRCTYWDAFGSYFRNFVFVAPLLNPLFPNKIRNIQSPFYRDLY